MSTEAIIFDIETGPLPDDELNRIRPAFDAGSVSGTRHVGEDFEPSSVKTGNISDPGKVAAKIEQRRIQHAHDQAEMVRKIEEARTDHVVKHKERAALSSLSGKLLALGYSDGDNCAINGHEEEHLLLNFWNIYRTCRDDAHRMVGYNIFGFDLPFLVRRSWLLGLQWPDDVFDFERRRWHWVFVDLMPRWELATRERESLDTLAKAFRIGSKPDGIHGGDFARLWAEDRPTAEAYLKNDLAMTRALAVRLGVITEGE